MKYIHLHSSVHDLGRTFLNFARFLRFYPKIEETEMKEKQTKTQF